MKKKQRSKSAPRRRRYTLAQQLKDMEANLDNTREELMTQGDELDKVKLVADANLQAKNLIQAQLAHSERARQTLRETLYNVLVQLRGTISYKPLTRLAEMRPMIAKHDPQIGITTIFIKDYSPGVGAIDRIRGVSTFEGLEL